MNECNEMLAKINRIASNRNARSYIPSILIQSDEKKEVIRFAREYASIKSKHSDIDIPIVQEADYIEISFMPDDGEIMLRQTLNTPKEVALFSNMMNHFYGVILVDLTQLNDMSLPNRLLPELIRENIFASFVIHISTDFNSKHRLISLLRQYINIAEANVDVSDYAKQIIKDIEDEGFKIDYAAKKMFGEYIQKNIFSQSDTSILSKRIKFELYLQNKKRVTVDIASMILSALYDVEVRNDAGIGFHIVNC